MHLLQRFLQIFFGEDFAANKVAENPPSTIGRRLSCIIVIFILVKVEVAVLSRTDECVNVDVWSRFVGFRRRAKVKYIVPIRLISSIITPFPGFLSLRLRCYLASLVATNGKEDKQ
jgi:hypothetical protein